MGFAGRRATIAALWLALIAFLYATRPEQTRLRESARLVPDTFRLVRRLAADRTIPRKIRLPIWLLVVYLASPIDLVPDFIPIVGYTDDTILISFVLRRVIRRTGPEKLNEHWPGTPDGLDRLKHVLRIGDSN